MNLIFEFENIVEKHTHDKEMSRAIVRELFKTFGGNKLYLPSYSLRERNEEIHRLHKSGMSRERLAHRYRVSKKTISRILSHDNQT